MHVLVNFARKCILSIFSDEEVTLPDGFNKPQGCFVTLYKDDQLRGCIGFITSQKSLKQTVREAAIAAATNDPRFPPVSEDEVDLIKIEVSVLSHPQRVENSVLAKQQSFVPESTGLIVQMGWKSGLLLPQVFTKETSASEALEMTCEKAQLPSNEWMKNTVSVFTFTVEVYKEV